MNSADVLDINLHPLRYFTNVDWIPRFKFGNKNTNAIILPHAGLDIVYPIFEYAFSNIKKQYDKIVILSTNHRSDQNFQSTFNIIGRPYIKLEMIADIKIDNEAFFQEHSYLSVLPYIAKFNISTHIIIIGKYDVSIKKILEEKNH